MNKVTLDIGFVLFGGPEPVQNLTVFSFEFGLTLSRFPRSSDKYLMTIHWQIVYKIQY
jgi:hypothetical protein